MNALSFEHFTKKIYIKASISELFKCWATTAGITSWFLSKAKYVDTQNTVRNAHELVQIGDRYTWEWHNWEGEEKGEVLQTNSRDFLEISFAGSKVSITLEDAGTATLLTLTQYQIPTDEESILNIHYGCSNGWTFWLANLKAFKEHGILLNEREFDLTQIPLAGFEFVNM